MHEDVVRALNLLANIADITEPSNYRFDVDSSEFKPSFKNENTKKIVRSKNRRKIFDVISQWTLISSLLGLLILTFIKSIHPQARQYNIFLVLGLIFIIIALTSVIMNLISTFIEDRERREKDAKRNIVKARKDTITYQPIVGKLCEIEKNNQYTLEYVKSIINNLVDETQAGEKKTSNLLPILAPIFAGLIILVGFPIQLPKNASWYNTLVTLVGVGTLFIPVFKFINESDSQSEILKYKRCLSLLEQAQYMANNAESHKLELTQQQQVLGGVEPPSGVPGKELLRFAGTIDPNELQMMEKAIQEGCEQVNDNEW